MALFSRKNIKSIELPYGLTEKDLKGEIEDFPMGVVVRMLEEQKYSGNEPDVKVFQSDNEAIKDKGGFDWFNTEKDFIFWRSVIRQRNFSMFFKRYPDYEKYNIS